MSGVVALVDLCERRIKLEKSCGLEDIKKEARGACVHHFQRRWNASFGLDLLERNCAGVVCKKAAKGRDVWEVSA